MSKSSNGSIAGAFISLAARTLRRGTMSFRRTLSKYIETPESNPELVIFYNDEVVLLRDAYPKARIHWLLMPRDVSAGWPLDLLTRRDFACDSNSSSDSGSRSGPGFGSQFDLLRKLKPWVTKFQKLAEAELQKYCKTDEEIDTEGLIRCGVHSVPSMDNLHIHIISKDMHSLAMKKAPHYLSFNTEFFVQFHEIDHLAADDFRYDSQQMHQLLRVADLRCVWCHRNFERKFTALKHHLAEEYAQRFSNNPSSPLITRI